MTGRPIETGRYYGELMRELNTACEYGAVDGCLDKYPISAETADAVRRHIAEQIDVTGCLPDSRTIIAEHFADDAGDHQLMIHSIFGMRVNRVLSILLRHEAEKLTGLDVRSYADDDGFMLYLIGVGDIPDGLLARLRPDDAYLMLDALLPAENMFSMAYRYAAARAGMMGMNNRGRQPLWIQRLKGAESLAGAVGQSGHPLIAEANRECRDDLLDISGAIEVMRDIISGEIKIVELHTEKPSPMALPMRRQVEAEMMYDTVIPAGAKEYSHRQLEGITPDREAVEKRFERTRAIDSPEALHSALMAEGDMLPGEIEAPAEWFELLASAGRAMYIEPGLWIAAEHESEYVDAPTRRILRRLIRFRGAQDARSVAQRYAITETRAREMLSSLEQSGEARMYDGMYIHPDVYSSAQRLTISMRRSEISTLPPERLARMVGVRVETAGSPKAKLRSAMEHLTDVEVPAAVWEDVILPRRVPGYRGYMLDQLLSEGNIVCSLRKVEGKPHVAFRRVEDIELDEYVPAGKQPEYMEKVLSALERGGAQFDYVISRRLDDHLAFAHLQQLAEQGLVRQDSFEPVRRMLNPKSKKDVMQSNGRWERMGVLRGRDIDEIIDACFRRYPILCRETCTSVQWAHALERLRMLEMAGEVRRGYFVSGLSGAQFVKTDDFAAVTAALGVESNEHTCLNAADPDQLWGKVIRHVDGREFMCIPGTAVVMRGGLPVCVFERNGAVLKLFEQDADAVKCFADAFRSRRIFSTRSRVVVKDYPREAAPMLEKAGFMREMLDYVLYLDR